MPSVSPFLKQKGTSGKQQTANAANKVIAQLACHLLLSLFSVICHNPLLCAIDCALCVQDNKADYQSRQLFNIHVSHQDAVCSNSSFAPLHENGKAHEDTVCNVWLRQAQCEKPVCGMTLQALGGDPAGGSDSKSYLPMMPSGPRSRQILLLTR